MSLDSARRFLRKAGLIVPARRAKEILDPSRRAAARANWAEARALAVSPGPAYGSKIRSAKATKTVLVNGMDRVSFLSQQSPLLAAFRLAGMEPVIILESRSSGWLETAYRTLGVDRFVYYEDVLKPGRHPETDEVMRSATDMARLLDFQYRGTALGRYAMSTLMRRLRRGNLDLAAPQIREAAAAVIDEALRYTDAAAAIVDRFDPAAALILDRGYTPQGQIFDLMMKRTGACFTWNAAFRNGLLMLKRYHPGNFDVHPATLSEGAWAKVRSMPWSEAKWRKISGEIDGCYRTGEWFAGVGTQVDKQFPAREELIARLGIDPSRKTAIVFPHIFWDSTFFWGVDLFGNFENWYKVVLKAACANPSLNWLVKVHPANLVKDRRDGYAGEHSEITAMREAVGELPSHVKLLPADTDISTLALFDVMDYCLTVRGTVGIEAACAGVPVITAGTGRYDRLGFTVDPETPEQYLDLLSRLADLPPMAPEKVELARRFAYGIFAVRPTPLASISFSFRRDGAATMDVMFDPQAAADPLAAPDVGAIARWIESGEEDFLNVEALNWVE